MSVCTMVGRLLLSTTHTHSGPSASSLSDNPEPWAARYFEQLAGSLTSLVREVERSTYSGYAQVGLSEARIGANRRGTKLPIDPRVVLISLYDPEGRLTGPLFHYSCHLTVLGIENYLASADWVGPVRRQMEQRLGVHVAFLQGAEGNIDPLTRGLLDMAGPDQAKGSSFQEMEVLSAEMVQFLRRGLEASPLHRVDTVRSLNREVSLPLRYGPLSREQVAQKEAEWKQQFASFLGISIDRIPEDGSINGLIKAHCRQHRISPEETRLWVSRQYAFSSCECPFSGPRVQSLQAGLRLFPLQIHSLTKNRKKCIEKYWIRYYI